VIHLHGGHVPAASDGYPEATILPGEETTYGYPNAQPASTLWYHDHALGITRLNVYMGLAGFYLLRDAEEAALGLPGGEFEVPAVIQDREFSADGTLFYPPTIQDAFGNGAGERQGLAVPQRQARQVPFPLAERFAGALYCCGWRIWPTHPGHPVHADRHGRRPDRAPTPQHITMAPAERFDVVLDFPPSRPAPRSWCATMTPRSRGCRT
jgi:FtsP/CotA-like multicopper oxidase with cupredoxin domain